MSGVIIGMDPHKRSATIEVMASDETVAGGGRYGTDAAGYAAMLAEVKRWPERTWAAGGLPGHRPAYREPAAGRGQGRGGRAARAVGPHPGVRHRAGPQGRCHRCALCRAGRHPDAWPAPGHRGLAARGAADPRRPAAVASEDHTRMVSPLP